MVSFIDDFVSRADAVLTPRTRERLRLTCRPYRRERPLP